MSLSPSTNHDNVLEVVRYQQFSFKNRRQNSCVTREQYRRCQSECLSGEQGLSKTITNTVNKKFARCRFPFGSVSADVPYCQTNKKTGGSYNKLYLHIMKKAYTMCNKCGRRCELVTFHIGTRATVPLGNSTRITLAFSDDVTMVYRERFTYDFISLLCDVGGNMGFYFGWSLLSVFQIGHVLIVVNRMRRRSPPPSYVDPIQRKTAKVFTAEKLGSQTSNSERARGAFNCKVVVVVLCHALAAAALVNRTVTYSKGPTAVLLDVKSRVYIRYPELQFCDLPSAILRKKVALAEQKGTSDYNDITLIDVWPLVNDSFNAQQLWTVSLNNEQRLFSKHSRFNFTRVDLVCGRGAAHPLDWKPYMGPRTELYFMIPSKGKDLYRPPSTESIPVTETL